MSDPSICIEELIDKLSEYDGRETAILDESGLSIVDDEGNEIGFVGFY